MAMAANTPRIDSLTAGASVAVCLLNPQAQFHHVYNFLWRLQWTLRLPVAGVVGLVMVGQPLVLAWQEWKVALTVGASISCKLLFDESFFVGDIADFVPEYTVDQIVGFERSALKLVQLFYVPSRLTAFRAAMLEAVIRQRAALPPPMPVSHAMRVLIVEDDRFARSVHRELVRAVNPNADVTACSNSQDAMEYCAAMNAASMPISLVLLDLVLQESNEHSSVIHPGSEEESGFDFATQFKENERYHHMDVGSALVVLISSAVHCASHIAACKHQGIDVVLPKPLTFNKVAMAMGHCWPDE